MTGKTKVPYRCSFCGKSQEQVRKLIAGQGVYICDECINLCQEIIEEEMLETPRAKSTPAALPSPRRIKEKLDAYVISQDAAKKVLSVAVSRGDLPGPDGAGPASLDRDATAPALAELGAYFAGRLRTFSLALDLGDAAVFDAAVWQAARWIPYGETVSYGELAAMAGYPRAARAAGGAMARCPLSPVVPCHRVIHADGSIGGWGTDLWVKRWLLDLERG